MKHAQSEAGNVFFLILLGVALFAAFTAAVMSSSSKSGSANPERDKLEATDIVKYGNTLKGAVDLMRSQGLSEADISFANATVAGYGTVGANPAGEIFNFDGGGLTYDAPTGKWLDSTYSAQTGYGEWNFVGSVHARDVGTPVGSNCAAAGCAELIAFLPYVKKVVCQQINAQLGAVASANITPSANIDSSLAFTKFTGTFAATDQVGDDPAIGVFNGRMNGCVQGSGSPAVSTYHYYQVLIAR